VADPSKSQSMNEYGLTARQEAFVREYVANGGNGTLAAKDAGYGDDGAHSRAYELLKMPKIQGRMETVCRELMASFVPGCLQSLHKLAVSASSETVKASAAATLLDRTGYKAPILLEVTDHRSQDDVDKELAVLLGLDSLDVPDEQGDTHSQALVKH